MLDSSNAPSLWTVALAVLGGGTVAGLLNLYVHRSTPRYQQLHLAAQTRRERAEARKLRAESDLSVARGAFELLARVEAEVTALRIDRDYWKARAEKAERAQLEEELKRLPEPPGE